LSVLQSKPNSVIVRVDRTAEIFAAIGSSPGESIDLLGVVQQAVVLPGA
jgi:hypothetical protein